MPGKEGGGMSKLPKLKLIMPHKQQAEEIRDFEEAEKFLSNWGMLVVVEGQVINSYQELVKLANQDSYKNKEFLEVTVIPFIEGG
jgi:hypothetical protein